METIKFHNKLYKLGAIKLAIKDFSGFADFVFSRKGNYFSVKIKNLKKSKATLVKDEFCNYVLALMLN